MDDEQGPRPGAASVSRASTRQLDPGLMADRLSFRVRSVLALLGNRVIEAFEPFGLRAGSFTAMALISANPGCSQVELAREGGLEKTSLVFIVNDLEARGYAVRARCQQDRRRSSLFLTAEGERVMREMYDAVMKTERAIRDAFTEQELHLLFELLERTYSILASEDRPRA